MGVIGTRAPTPNYIRTEVKRNTTVIRVQVVVLATFHCYRHRVRLGLEITVCIQRDRTEENRQRGHSFMEAFLLMLLVVGLLIFAGVKISVRLYTQGALGTGRFRRIRRVRFLRPKPGDTVMEEETVEEILDEEVPD